MVADSSAKKSLALIDPMGWKTEALRDMWQITLENVCDYFRNQGRDAEAPEILAGGVSNVVLRVRVEGEIWVVKQSCPQLRTKDAWFSDLDRIYREQEVMQALEPHLPAGTVPKVLFVDRPNYVYAMTHAPLQATVWKADLLAGKVDATLSDAVGGVLGKMHQISVTHRPIFENFADHHVYVQLRVDPFYRRVQERRPEVAPAVAPIIDEMLTRKEALCHGDYTPKNMLVLGSTFTLVDYETAHLGDPTMDLGLLFTHLVLKAFRDPEKSAIYIDLLRSIWRAYVAEVRFASAVDLEKRGMKHLAVCLLARIDGTSPVDYLPWEDRRDAVRRLGRAILSENWTAWEDAWSMLPR